jgi:hypothetical protein
LQIRKAPHNRSDQHHAIKRHDRRNRANRALTTRSRESGYFDGLFDRLRIEFTPFGRYEDRDAANSGSR